MEPLPIPQIERAGPVRDCVAERIKELFRLSVNPSDGVPHLRALRHFPDRRRWKAMPIQLAPECVKAYRSAAANWDGLAVFSCAQDRRTSTTPPEGCAHIASAAHSSARCPSPNGDFALDPRGATDYFALSHGGTSRPTHHGKDTYRRCRFISTQSTYGVTPRLHPA